MERPSRSNREGLLQKVAHNCIYEAAGRGGVVPLFKSLITNACSHTCKYCFTRCSRRKVMFSPEEYARVFSQFFREGKVTGVFISSGILRGDPDRTTERMLEATRLIRDKYHFTGYVHFKCLPGTSRELLEQAAQYADRMSVNVEAPSASYLGEIAPEKDYARDILLRQRWLADIERRGLLPSGHTTQFVVGAAGESDADILGRVNWEYQEVNLRRAYFSRFSPLKGTPLEHVPAARPARERRLYMADFLLRLYPISFAEFRGIFTDAGALPPGDPKVHLARAFFDAQETVDVNEAPYPLLVRVPGIGPKTARSILRRRARQKIQKARDLRALGVNVRKALPFVSISGSRQATLDSLVSACAR